MTSAPDRIYWDASAWIAYIQQEMPNAETEFTEPRYEMCRETLKRAASGEVEIATSAFTLAEVCKPKKSTKGKIINLPAFFDQEYILLIPVDKAVGLKAQYIQQSGISKIKPPDATHLASAVVWDIPILHTFDKRLLDKNGQFTTDGGNQIKICMPTEEAPEPPLLSGMGRHDPKK